MALLHGEAWGHNWDDDVDEEEYVGKEPKAKPDTVFLCDAATDITADLSQMRTDLSSSSSSGYEENSARTALAEPFAVEIEFAADNTNAGALLNHGNTAATSFGFQLHMDAGDFLLHTDAGILVYESPLSLLSGSTQRFLLQWTAEDDPDNAGKYRHVLTIKVKDSVDPDECLTWRLDNQDAIPTLDTEELTVGGLWNGAGIDEEFDGTIYWVRLSEGRFHAVQEMIEDFEGFTDFGSPESVDQCSKMLVPRDANMADDGEFAGLANSYAVSAHREMTRRLLSQMWPMLANNVVTYQDDLTDTLSEAWVESPPGELTWQTAICWLARVPVSDQCNRLRVHIQLQQWRTDNGPPQWLEVRAYTSGRPPGHLALEAERYYHVFQRKADDGSAGMGARLQSRGIKIVRENDGDPWTWVWLAVRVNEGTASSSFRYRIRECSVEPESFPIGAKFNGWNVGNGNGGGGQIQGG